MGNSSTLGLWLSYIKTYRLVQAELSQRLKRTYNISLPQFQLLSQLASGDAVRMGELASALLMTNGNITGLAGRLEKLGWVEFTQDAKDKRVNLLRLSRSGQAEFETILSDYETWVEELFGGIQPDEYERFRANIHAIRPQTDEN